MSDAVSFWTLGRAATALGVPLPPGADASLPLRSVCTDTRALQPGDLFVALRGEHFDAHRFLDAAVSGGAAALVIEDVAAAAHLDPSQIDPSHIDPSQIDPSRLGVPLLVVADTLVALGALARERRRAWGGPVVAVAGSNGKTSTKELLLAALGSVRRVHATAGNFNNRVGLPLTLLAIPDDAELAVIEAGTNVPGEVAILRDICEPQVAVVTSIGEEHLEGLHDLDGVLAEEASIFDGVALAVTPAAQKEIAGAAGGRARAVLVAGLEDGDLHADSWRLLDDGTGVLEVAGTTVHVPLRGIHNLRNAMLALAVARHFGVSLDDAARGIGAMPQPSMRMAWEPMGSAVVLNDAYNANPPSMRAAFELMAALDGGRPRVAVLGTMRELGESTARLHEEIARAALDAPFDVVAGVGLFADALGAAVAAGCAEGRRVVTAPDVDELWPLLQPRLAPDALILLKGSRGARLERLLPYLSAWATR